MKNIHKILSTTALSLTVIAGNFLSPIFGTFTPSASAAEITEWAQDATKITINQTVYDSEEITPVELPNVSETPDAPEMPTSPEAPDVPDTPDAPEAPDAPDDEAEPNEDTPTDTEPTEGEEQTEDGENTEAPEPTENDENTEEPEKHLGTELLPSGKRAFSGEFTYRIEETDGQNVLNNIPELKIVFDKEELVDNRAQKTLVIDLSEATLNADLGKYQFKLSCTTKIDGFECADVYYTFEILVVSKVDNNNVPTGQLYASVGNLRKFINGKPAAGKVASADFLCEHLPIPQGDEEPETTFLKITNTVEGEHSSVKDVFRYEFYIDGNEGDIYELIAPAGKYVFEGKEVKNPTQAKAGETTVFYLRHNESATIGLTKDGAYQIPVGSTYRYIEYPDVKDYVTWIDDKSKGHRVMIIKTAVLDPKGNETLYINTRTIPEEVEIEEFVNTGIVQKGGIYLILAAVAAIGLVVMLLFKSRKEVKDES